jgi:hypothetical protein
MYLKYGTSSAESLTCSFWVKTNKTGTYSYTLNGSDFGEYYTKSFTINSANTWEKKTITIPGNTANNFTNDNTNGMELFIWLSAGSNYTSGSIQNAWTSSSSATHYAPEQTVNIADSTSNEWYITGVQLEAGTTASDFEFLPYDVNLNKCLRYYFTDALYSSGGNTGLAEMPICTSNANFKHIFKHFPVTMRAAPTISNITIKDNVTSSSNNLSQISGDYATTMTVDIYGRDDSSTSAAYYHGAEFSAEL